MAQTSQTSVYGLPYLELTDPPNIAAGTKNLAEAVETELARIDTAVGNIQSRLPQVLPGICVARLRRLSTSTVPNDTPVPWDFEDWDDLDAFSSGSTRFQPSVAGGYLVAAVVRHQPISGGSAITAAIMRNGTTQASATISANTSPSAGSGITVIDVVALNGSSDYVEVRVGNSQATDVNCAGSVVTITYAGPP